MPKVSQIFDFTQTFAPVETAEQWDNCGILVGDKNADIKKAMLCLDITNEVVAEAVDSDCQLIISHHPVIFSPLKAVEKGSVVYNLIKADISAICLHTNLDLTNEDGVNVCLAKALNLKDIHPAKDDYLYIGQLNRPMSSDEFALYVKDALRCNGVRYTSGKDISTVAVSSGAGSDSVELFDKYNFDAFVTGELKHHHFLYAKEHNICAVEAGHYNTEDVVITPLLKKLQDKFDSVSFIKSESLTDPVNFI